MTCKFCWSDRPWYEKLWQAIKLRFLVWKISDRDNTKLKKFQKKIAYYRRFLKIRLYRIKQKMKGWQK